MSDPLYALVADGKVHSLSSDPAAWPHDLFPTLDLSTVDGIAVGWIANEDGTFSAPKLADPVQEPVLTYKGDLYRRCNDEEAAAIEVALAAAPVRERRLFESVQYLDHVAPEFGTLRGHLVEMFGKDRADELLAPSV